MRRLEEFYKWLWDDNLSTTPKDSTWFAKAATRIIFIVIKGFGKHDFDLRACALTYTVILSLVPMLAMGTALLKGLGADNYMKAAAYKVIIELEEMASHEQHSGNFTTEANVQPGQANIRNGSLLHLRAALDKIFEYVDKTNFATIGWLGIVGAIFTVVALMTHIEAALNAIWETKKARRIGRKIIDYIGLVILLPISVNFAFWAITAAQSETLVAKITSMLRVSWVLPLMFKLLPILLIVGTFSILYHFMPNTEVKVIPALSGGLIGGLGWILVQTLYIKLQIGVARYNAIYGSFATFPLFIFWLYIGWLVFLMGAQTSYAVQKFKRYVPLAGRITPLHRLALAVDILDVTYRYFDAGRGITAEEISDELGYPLMDVVDVMKKLRHSSLILPSEDGTHFLPGISAEHLEKTAIFHAMCGRLESDRTHGQQIASMVEKNAKLLLDKENEKIKKGDTA